MDYTPSIDLRLEDTGQKTLLSRDHISLNYSNTFKAHSTYSNEPNLQYDFTSMEIPVPSQNSFKISTAVKKSKPTPCYETEHQIANTQQKLKTEEFFDEFDRMFKISFVSPGKEPVKSMEAYVAEQAETKPLVEIFNDVAQEEDSPKEEVKPSTEAILQDNENLMDSDKCQTKVIQFSRLTSRIRTRTKESPKMDNLAFSEWSNLRKSSFKQNTRSRKILTVPQQNMIFSNAFHLERKNKPRTTPFMRKAKTLSQPKAQYPLTQPLPTCKSKKQTFNIFQSDFDNVLVDRKCIEKLVNRTNFAREAMKSGTLENWKKKFHEKTKLNKDPENSSCIKTMKCKYQQGRLKCLKPDENIFRAASNIQYLR